MLFRSGFNINPSGSHKRYIADLEAKLQALEDKAAAGEIQYIVFCHGADSHEWDELGSQCTTGEWLECSAMVYSMVKRLDEKLGRPFPLALALFGGYRRDDYDSVLNLHAGDLSICLETLCGAATGFIPRVKRR